MRRSMPIFYSALLLTGVNLLLRLVGTSFQVFVSGRIGAAGVGLLQLVLSVGAMATTAGIAGIRTATMYLTAEELGRKRPGSVRYILSGCFVYALVCGGAVSAGLYIFAPKIAESWIGDPQTASAIRLLAVTLPVTCLGGVMTGYFTAANRIGTLAAVEVAEQLCSMAVTMGLLNFWAGQEVHRACTSVVLGGSMGACLTLVCLLVLRCREKPEPGRPIRVKRRILDAAVPLAMADDLKAAINTTENLMVPKRLALYAGTDSPLALFGTVCGMVFPVLMFPAAILFGLNELLIPELARCNAAGSERRIHYLVRRSLRIAMLYGVTCGGILHLLSTDLCEALYGSAEAGKYLKIYAFLAPMLYTDSVTDAMTKGLGQQKICVRYNILTSVLDVIFLYFLLPEYGMEGYFISFLATHLLNFLLSITRLLKITGLRIPIRVPLLTITVMLLAIWGAGYLPSPFGRVFAYLALLFSALTLLGIVSGEDALWLKGLIYKK